ncbi:MAG: OmpA family protein [Alloprevotella sp.]|nr:OmpA family protein [Alloprevotella sp.]MBR1652752.1 OmpA family protein [Alloprevotella sp.]MBR1653261.1 OmpA family protein [Alloprevotella sp.]
MERIVYILLALCLTACSPVERIVRRGDNALAIGEYAEAAALYKKAYQRTPTTDRQMRGELAFKQADAFRRYGNAARALGAYRSAERYKYSDSLTLVRAGDMMRMMGDMKGARDAYSTALDSNPDLEAARLGIQAAEGAMRAQGETSAWTVKLASQFNSSRSDYCPAYQGTDASALYFSTTRRQVMGEDLSGITAMKPGDIYVVRKDEKGKWKMPEAVEGGVNTEFDEGACAFTPDGTKMYLTVCKTDPQYPRMAQIMVSSRSDASWGKPQEVKITKDTLSSYAHPAVSPDGRWLYFTSDMPGGYGGLDLWRIELDAKGGGVVENLGPDINTAGNECFPAFRPSGELYFSSDGRPQNYGGLDLYRATADTLTHVWHVEHLPRPMNSQGDDFGITFEGSRSRGYFSSSRSTGGRGWDKLYEFSYPEQLLSVKGWVYEQDGYELPKAQVFMVGSDGTNQKLSVLSDGSFEQPVKAGVQYLFLATCPGYLNMQASLVPEDIDAERQYVLQFPLPSMNIPVLVRGIHYEFDKATLTPESQAALDRLVKLLQENTNVTIELSSHCDYRGRDAYNDRLSQQRAESVVNYLTEHGVDSLRLTARGYGKRMPKVVSKRMAETYPFLTQGDTLTEARIKTFEPKNAEIANALNRRTEFRVLSTTYGLFDEKGRLRTDLIRPARPEREGDADEEEEMDFDEE